VIHSVHPAFRNGINGRRKKATARKAKQKSLLLHSSLSDCNFFQSNDGRVPSNLTMAVPHFNLTPILPSSSSSSCYCFRCQHFRLLRRNACPSHSLLVDFALRPIISSPASVPRVRRMRALNRWILNAATTAPVLDNATVPSAASMEIPVTCYQLLGLRDQAEKDEVAKSVNQLKSAEIEEGYTTNVKKSREDLLEDVRAKLLFEDEYAGNVKEKIRPKSSLYIPWAWLPGALCLLQEVGEEKLVLEIGRMVIKNPDAKPHIHDILLSMAMAECAIATISFENNKVSLGFEALARAQYLLRSKTSLGKMGLLAQIEESLEELAPACTLEILGMPHSPENTERRRGAIAALRELLRQGLDVEVPCRVQGWPCFLSQALNRLRATEIVDLCPWDDLALTRKNKKSVESHTQRAVIDFSCFYVALIAHIALGFSSKQTKLIEKAKGICGALMASEGIDLKLEEAFCLFLLGEGNEALVVEKLQQVELNANPAPWSLAVGKEKNDAKTVKLSLKRTEVDKSKVHYQKSKRAVAQRPFSDFTSERMDIGESLSFQSSSQHLGSAVKQLAFTDFQTSLLSDKNDSVTNEDQPTVQLKRTLDMRDDETWGSWPSYNTVIGKIVFVCVLGCIVSLTSKLSIKSLRGSTPKCAFNQQNADTISSGESGMSNKMKQLSATVKTQFYKLPLTRTSQNSGLLGRLESSNRALSRKQMPFEDAEMLVRQWQTVKAEALGPGHNIQSLSELLADSMLDQFQALADAAQSKSCYWRFVLLDLSILKADIVSDGFGMEMAEIEALLEEVAELVGESEPKNPNYHSKYKIHYVLKRQDDGSWRFCKGDIQPPS
ncbi:Plastid division protein CDP1, chloroplastic, partial [Linum perenne]